MSIPSKLTLLLPLALVLSASAKDKKKPLLPDYVLRARTVMVVVNPGSEVPVANPGENRKAQDDVEQALLKWGRFNLALDSQTADLVISVRRGRMVSPTITGGPTANRPVVLQQPGDGQVRVGGEQGRRPDLSDPGLGGSQNTGPHGGTEIGSSDDRMEVYRGGTAYPLDSAPVWAYSGHNALDAPSVPAVHQFRKAIEEAEKQQKNKP
jgi:hypothetical protein